MQESLEEKKVVHWFGKRLPWDSIREFVAGKTVPRHRHTFWYIFGGLTGFFLVVQIITGILLALYYSPTPDTAYESVRNIVNQVPHGWLIRSIHSWSANLMVGSLFVHMFSTLLMKAYRRPRELMWITGVLLLLIVLGFAFTGYLLPWDTRAYFATLIGTEVPKALPIVGAWGVSLIKGGDEIGAATLSRMHTIHIVVLPITILFVVTLHVLLNQYYGVTVPQGVKRVGKPIPFVPNFMYRDFLAWTIGLALLLGLAMLIPWGLGDKADPLGSAPVGIKPEWYFLPLYQTLRLVPSRIFSVNGELIVNLFVTAAIAFWIAIPFIDRESAGRKMGVVFTGVGVCVACYLATMIILAYTT